MPVVKMKHLALPLTIAAYLSPNLSASAAVTTQLCANIDGSGSVSSTDFTLQKQGLASAVTDPNIVPQNGTVAIAVVQFSSSAQLEVPLVTIDSAATAATVAAQINAIAQFQGTTATDLGISLCANQLTKNAAVQSVIDTSTDGFPNDLSATSAAADAAITAGVDALNTIGVGSGVSVTGLEASTRPTPALAPPFDDGFYIIAADFQAYEAAIKEKIKQEVQAVGVPANGPIGLALLAGLLAGLGWFGARRRQVLR